jgi:xanthine/uracil permease
MTGRNYDPLTGRALLADGVATTLAGLGGGSGTTTYAENIGVMAASRVYSTAAYWVAAFGALVLSLSPKFGALIASVPDGVLGGVTTMLYGMIGILGARIWVQGKVNFSDPVNLTTAAVPLVIGIADFTWTAGDLQFGGIALGTAAALVIYHVMGAIGRWRGTAEA